MESDSRQRMRLRSMYAERPHIVEFTWMHKRIYSYKCHGGSVPGSPASGKAQLNRNKRKNP
jgi:hypothetical protein